MIKFIDSVLRKFRNCFSRSAAYHWFVVVIIGLLTRTEFLGVTSFMRCFSFAPKAYDSLIKFFRSDAYTVQSIRTEWYAAVKENASLYQLNGKNLLAGDGTKHPKEGARMPGVKKLMQESGNQCHLDNMRQHDAISSELEIKQQKSLKRMEAKDAGIYFKIGKLFMPRPISRFSSASKSGIIMCVYGIP